MQINFVGRNFELTDAIKSYASEKLKLLTSRFNKITSIQIILEIEHTNQIAEAILQQAGSAFHASAKSNDMYEAIDQMVEKLLGQLTKYKEKIIDQHR